MKIKIKYNTEEKLLSRHKILAEIDFDKAVPARKDIIQQLAVVLGIEPDLVVVKKIDASFGSRNASVHAVVYKNKADRDKIEAKNVLAKTGFNMPKIEKTTSPAAQAAK